MLPAGLPVLVQCLLCELHRASPLYKVLGQTPVLAAAPAQVRDFFQRVQLSPIDTYFMIDCVNGGKVPEPVDPSRISQQPPQRL